MVWKNEHITTAIPGFSNYDELDECLVAARSPELTAGDQEYLATLCGQEMLYCQQCGKCRAQCPEHLPIPDIMRPTCMLTVINIRECRKKHLEN